MNASGMRRVIATFGHTGLWRALMLLAPLASILAGAAVLISMFEPGDVVRALHGADVGLIALAFCAGAVIQALQAARASLLLSRHRPAPWDQTFGIQVVSHGLGHLIPLAPATMGLRCLLTYRINNIPVLFSAGVFLAANVLDGSALLPLLGYLLALVSLPLWLRLLLSGMLLQTVLFLLVPLMGGSLVMLLVRVLGSRMSESIQPAARMVECAASSMAIVAKGDWTRTLLVVTLTLSMTALGMLRLDLLLEAFALPASFSQLCLLMVLSSLVGRLPFPIPGAGTWATAKALGVAGIAGSGVSGYILILRTISSIETPILALCVLAWWSLPWCPSTIRLKDIRQMRSVPEPALVPLDSTNHGE